MQTNQAVHCVDLGHQPLSLTWRYLFSRAVGDWNKHCCMQIEEDAQSTERTDSAWNVRFDIMLCKFWR